MGWVVLGVECMLMCMGSELCCGCNVVAILSMADMVCLAVEYMCGMFSEQLRQP